MTGVQMLILMVSLLLLSCTLLGLLLANGRLKEENDDLIKRINREFAKSRELAWKAADPEQARIQGYIAEYARLLPLYVSDPMQYKLAYNNAMQDVMVTLVTIYHHEHAKREAA